MTERAAHMLDHVFPDVPVRQRVLTLPKPLLGQRVTVLIHEPSQIRRVQFLVLLGEVPFRCGTPNPAQSLLRAIEVFRMSCSEVCEWSGVE